MRDDMFEVLLERPRRRWRWQMKRARDGRERARNRRDPEQARAYESIRFHTNPVHPNENLAPLMRFLTRRVGRHWNKVHSEICAQLEPASAVQKHVLDHLRDMVALHTYVVDGEVWTADRWGRPVQLLDPKWRRYHFYVCPKTGILRSVPRVARTKRPWWRDQDHCWFNPLKELVREGGQWYLVRRVWARSTEVVTLDPSLRERLGATLFAELEAYHNRPRRVPRESSRTLLTAAQAAELLRMAPRPEGWE